MAARLHQHAMAMLKSNGDFSVEYRPDGNFSGLPLGEFEALLIRSQVKVDKKLLDQFLNLRVLVTCTSGFDHIDLKEVSERGLKVYQTASSNAASAAELTWALVLACARETVKAHNMVLKGVWKRDLLSGIELSEKMYGVVGFGRVGQRVARMAQGFGMQVLVYDPYVETSEILGAGYQCLGLVELLRSADVMSFHVPLTSETRRMLNSTSLDNFNDGAIVVNTSRGEIFVEQHIVDALSSGKIARLGLDVFEREPLDPASLLCRHPNVVLSPHIGATTEEAIERASIEGARKVVEFFGGGNPDTISDALPPKAAWYTHPRGFN